ncbi:glycosyltransferase family 2 protein [Candidatus Eisenbacteria bacterium]|uniref:Glycosyltransferase family 2 protein n=1 Tax=Eiseniibacteriota bacterium TaxID=2212470 RepID=A0ABV6YPQ5_UNCEI
MSTKIVVVMPAYNAEQTLIKTLRDIPEGSVAEIILVDDHSQDNTAELARSQGIRVIEHRENRGYGANQKTCYREALESGADIIVMIHPDYQYDPRLIPFAAGFISADVCDVIIGSRIRTRREALDGGMPVYKYLSNRILTVIENIVLGQNLGDFHSGFRVYGRAVLEGIDFSDNSDDFVFDTEFLAQAVFHGFRIGDIPIPTRYSPDSSSINFRRSLTYGFETLLVMAKYLLQRSGIYKPALFRK